MFAYLLRPPGFVSQYFHQITIASQVKTKRSVGVYSTGFFTDVTRGDFELEFQKVCDRRSYVNATQTVSEIFGVI